MGRCSQWEPGYLHVRSIHKKETQITTSGSAYNPKIYDNRIVWTDTRNRNPDTNIGTDIYMATVSNSTQSDVLKINDFTAKIRSGTASLKTEFVSDVTGTNIVKWRWDFEPPGKDYNSAVTARHTFTKPVVYDITLRVWNAAGKTATLTKPAYIVVNPVATVKNPVAAFSASPTSGKAPLKVQFTDTSTKNPTSWKWSFGDGTYSTTKSPAHKYNKVGKYTVSLTLKNAKGSNTKTISEYITVKK